MDETASKDVNQPGDASPIEAGELAPQAGEAIEPQSDGESQAGRQVEPQADADAGAQDESQADVQLDGRAIATVEALLFASDAPLTVERVAKVAGVRGVRAVRQAMDALNARYESQGAAFRIEKIAGGYQMLTLPEYHDVLDRLLEAKKETHLSQPAMETLAIVAYRQPVLRADIEAIRGVSCGEVLRGLMERQLAKIVGRAEVLGRPMLYGTTKRFLETFGLGSLEDLPKAEELRQAITDKPKVAGATADAAVDVATSPAADVQAGAEQAAEPASVKPVEPVEAVAPADGVQVAEGEYESDGR